MVLVLWKKGKNSYGCLLKSLFKFVGLQWVKKTKLKNVCYDWEAQEKNDATSKLATEEQNVAALELLQNHMNTKP
jgi:hypothetical protein